jgi:hypothetical protein
MYTIKNNIVYTTELSNEFLNIVDVNGKRIIVPHELDVSMFGISVERQKKEIIESIIGKSKNNDIVNNDNSFYGEKEGCNDTLIVTKQLRGMREFKFSADIVIIEGKVSSSTTLIIDASRVYILNQVFEGTLKTKPDTIVYFEKKGE